MYQVMKKIKLLKEPIRDLMWQQGNLHDRVVSLRKELDRIQLALDKDISNSKLRELASTALKEYNMAALEEEKFLIQKSKVNWLREGDRNSEYFHRIIKGKQHRSRIQSITNSGYRIFLKLL